MYAFIVSIVLFTVGGLFALYEAWHKFEHPEPITGTWWWVPIAVLLIAIALEGFSFRTAITESNHVRGKRSWTEFVRTAKAPELPVILLEDLAALFGLVFALFGVSMHQIAAAIDAAEQRARAAVPGLGLVMYLEPDVDRGAFDPVSWQQSND